VDGTEEREGEGVSKDTATLARELLAGDLTAVIPLLDELKANGDDWRARRLHEAAGYFLTGESNAEAFHHEIARLFWLECDPVERADALEEMGRELRAYHERRDQAVEGVSRHAGTLRDLIAINEALAIRGVNQAGWAGTVTDDDGAFINVTNANGTIHVRAEGEVP
jgi:inorganic triphosphatase YgiF